MQRVINDNIQQYADRAVVKLSILVACAAVLQVAESLIPHPLPGVRLGLANIITLIALVEVDFKSAFKIAILRTLIGSIILGTFLTPSFILSFSGGIVSAVMMALFYWLSSKKTGVRFSLLGISIIGSLAHNLTQIVLVYFLFIRNKGIILLWPWLAASAVVMGILTGLVAIQVCKRLGATLENETIKKINVNLSIPTGRFVPVKSLIHHLLPEVKIIFVLILALSIIMIKSFVFYAGIFFVLVIFTIIARLRFTALLFNFKRILSFIILSFVMPIIFTPSGNVIYSFGPLKFTYPGLIMGSSFAFRLILLFFATTLLALTTSPRIIAGGIETLLSPLQFIGIPVTRLAQSLCLSWSFFPILWAHAKDFLKLQPRRKNYLKGMINFLGDLVTEIYILSDQIALLPLESDTGLKIDKPQVKRSELSVKTGAVVP